MLKMLFQKECLLPVFAVFVCTLLFGTGCKTKETITPDGYQINKPESIELGKVLNEISGICLNKENGTLLAISDSKEQVFEMDLNRVKLRDYTAKVVPPDSDLEDLVKVNSSLFLLLSKGVIMEVPEKARDTVGIKTYTLNVNGVNDFETLYYDPTVNGLIMLCKSCDFEKGSGVRTAFRFDLSSRTFDSTVFYTINKDDVKRALKSGNAKFDPSAAAIHPINKRLYILSSAGNLLVITDTRGKVAEAYDLNPDLFPQAEGIAFAPNGDMFISNEAKYGKATLLHFPYVPASNKKK